MALGMPEGTGSGGGGMSSERLTGDWLKGYVGDRLYDCLRCCKTGMTHDATYRHEVFECERRPGRGAAKVGVDGHDLRGSSGCD